LAFFRKKKMRIKTIFLFFSLCAAAFANSVDDARISFSTKGPDCYADGSVVMDGECYALVWSRDGNFDGFAADGECVDPADRIVLIAPIAKNGCCPPVLFQIPAAEANSLANGKYAVYLLDTRVSSDGFVHPRGTENGKLPLLNGYGATTAGVALGGATSNQTVNECANIEGGQKASNLCAVPADCDQPRIKAMRIEGDNVFLTVENLKGFMRVSSGSDVSASDAATAAVETFGGDEDVTLVTRKPGNSGFFKVIRNNN
jgi:hypothetical protein